MAKERKEKMGEVLEIGDVVSSYGYNRFGFKCLYEFTIKEIISQNFWGKKPENGRETDWGYYLEFIGDDDHYHYWKQQFDGGCVYEKEVA